MKLLLITLPLLVNGCSLLGSNAEIPQVKPVEVVTVVQKAPMYHPPLPNTISSLPIEWTILNPELMQEYLDDLEEGNAPTNAWYALTPKGYENLSVNMSEVKRYLRQIISIVKYYRDLDEDTSKDE
jgi:DNA-binding PadR family transcriptional regulator